ncbi:MAG TPA: cupin [Alphaproteobacteria bacterium]|nr:cupin [Rhodospirillaceae bacterium]HRJ12870.1 cupin [Alphaproteobacteria bacterium]
MSRLQIFEDTNPETALVDTIDGAAIAAELKKIDVRFERWAADAELPADADDNAVLQAYAKDIERIKAEGGYTTVDILRVTKDFENKKAIREKFLNEHTHSEDEVRFFVEGSGMFYLRVGGKVYMTLCTAGDLISVPYGITHWFDMSDSPHITAIRFFENTEGWTPNFTGTDIAQQFPKYEKDAAA